MKIFFIGTVSFSKKVLEKLIFLNAEIVGVATKSKSDFNADHIDLTPLCIENHIVVKHIKDINAPHVTKWIGNLQPDIIFCCGWSSLIKKKLLELPKLGVVGFHPTELPENRGRHPLIWSIVLGLEKGAATFFFMEEGADDGDILSQKTFPILYEDDAASVYLKMEKSALGQIDEFLPSLQKGDYPRLKQDHSRGNKWRKRGINDGKIDFRMSSYAIYNLVRALTKPYIGAHLYYNEKEIKIWKVKEENFSARNIEPGKVLASEANEILVKTYDGAVRILSHSFTEIPQKGEYI